MPMVASKVGRSLENIWGFKKCLKAKKIPKDSDHKMLKKMKLPIALVVSLFMIVDY